MLPLINKADFDKLPTLEKRVVLCRDAIARLNADLIKPIFGRICRQPCQADHWDQAVAKLTNEQTQAAVNKGENCEGCAKGALLYSWVGNFDSFDTDSFSRVVHAGIGRGFPPELGHILGEELLCAIEVAYEGEHFDWIARYISGDEVEAILATLPPLPEGEFEVDDKTVHGKEVMTTVERKQRMIAVLQMVVDGGGVMRIGDRTFGEIKS